MSPASLWHSFSDWQSFSFIFFIVFYSSGTRQLVLWCLFHEWFLWLRHLSLYHLSLVCNLFQTSLLHHHLEDKDSSRISPDYPTFVTSSWLKTEGNQRDHVSGILSVSLMMTNLLFFQRSHFCKNEIRHGWEWGQSLPLVFVLHSFPSCSSLPHPEPSSLEQKERKSPKSLSVIPTVKQRNLPLSSSCVSRLSSSFSSVSLRFPRNMGRETGTQDKWLSSLTAQPTD